jgi:type I restriction enzyme S subunit
MSGDDGHIGTRGSAEKRFEHSRPIHFVNVLLSIEPEFAEKILTDTKRFDFRKTRFRDPAAIEQVFLYASSPVQEIVGAFTLCDVIADCPEELWNRFREESGIESYERFAEYFGDTDTGYAIEIDDVVRFDEPIDPWRHVDDFRPPVSFQYVDGELEFVLDSA